MLKQILSVYSVSYMLRVVSWALIGLWVLGCGDRIKPEVSAAHKGFSSPREVSVGSASKQEHYIKQLLYQARQALARDRLTSPVYDNSYDHYRKVLHLDQNNAEAKAGLDEIVGRYLHLAQRAQQDGKPRKVERYLSMAKVVQPKSAALAQWQAQIKSAQSTQKLGPLLRQVDNRYYINPRDLSAKTPRVQVQLEQLAQQAKALQSRLQIFARNDAEGRWIYQQMRRAVWGFRLRGNIEYDAEPSVVLLDEL